MGRRGGKREGRGREREGKGEGKDTGKGEGKGKEGRGKVLCLLVLSILATGMKGLLYQIVDVLLRIIGLIGRLIGLFPSNFLRSVTCTKTISEWGRSLIPLGQLTTLCRLQTANFCDCSFATRCSFS